MNRWCPSCRTPWPPETISCPDCFAELVDDLAATVHCRHCDRDWPARMQTCPVCLAELNPDPTVAADEMADLLAAGVHVFRPDGIPAFADGPGCSLVRLSARGSLVFLGTAGLVEAVCEGSSDRAAVPLTCRDHDGSVLFRMLAYDAADDAVVAVGAGGAPLATYLRAGTGIDVRDETSAPVAYLRRVRGGFELVETGGAALATVGSADAELEGWVDDQWWLAPVPGVGRLPLPPLGAVGLVLAAKILLGRPSPVRSAPADEPEGWQPYS